MHRLAQLFVVAWRTGEPAAASGHARCEIFPQQEQVLVERGEVGNLINLPYFDSEQTLRFAVIKVGKDYIEATLPQFIEQVHKI